jgi:hypothetical protein
MRGYFALIFSTLLLCGSVVFGQSKGPSPLLSDSSIRHILFSYYNNAKTTERNSFADPLDSNIQIQRSSSEINLSYTEHTLIHVPPEKLHIPGASHVNYFYSVRRKMKLDEKGKVLGISGHDTLYHQYQTRCGIGKDSTVSVMGIEKLHNYRTGSVHLYSAPAGKLEDSVSVSGKTLKVSMSCEIYYSDSGRGMTNTEYKLIAWKGKYFWAQSNWLKTTYSQVNGQEQTNQYMKCWMLEEGLK